MRKNRSIRRTEAFSDHRMACKIHKNIKSSLRETIKGRDPGSTSNTILSCALEASAHLRPPPHPLLCSPTPSPLSRVTLLLHLFLLSSQSRWRSSRPPTCAPALSLCTCPAAGYLLPLGLPEARPASLWRCSEEEERGRRNELLFNAVLARCPG